ncbi:hypothetical protein [Bacillus thuringiensis]|uniref:hypothetical protein n=1 Tax=Bacillus thuringiensis TaxID=1428 RepID=UPI002927F379|nr:hypothetical protein [Bacillus cereus]
MPWFLNTQTGVKWEINDPDHVTRCKNDSVYEIVDAIKEIGQKTNDTASNLASLKKKYTVEEMKELLTKRGIEFHSKATKDELAELLSE